MTITLTREEAQQVLDALEEYVGVVVSVNDPNNWTTKVSDGGEPARKAIETLRTRLEQPQPFQVLPHDFSRAVEQQVLAVLEWNLPLIEDFGDKEQLHEQHKAIETLRAKLSAHEPYKQPEDNRLLMQAYRAIHEKQPEPEPVAWMWDVYNGAGYSSRGIGFQQTDIPFAKHTPLYIAPPQREWQGLTDKEILADEVLRYHFGLNGGAGPVSKKGKAVIEAVTSKLKEKNT